MLARDENGNSKGFGFVNFQNSADAIRAIQGLHGKDGLYVQEAKPKEKRILELIKSSYNFKKSMQYMNLLVKGLDAATTEEDLHAYFGEYGQIKSLKLNKEACRAFVCFADREGAKNAKEQAPTKTFKGKHLFITYCEPRESRQTFMEELMDKKAYEAMKQKEFLTQKLPNSALSLEQVLGSLGVLAQNFLQGSNNFRNQQRYPSHSNGRVPFQQRNQSQPPNRRQPYNGNPNRLPISNGNQIQIQKPGPMPMPLPHQSHYIPGPQMNFVQQSAVTAPPGLQPHT